MERDVLLRQEAEAWDGFSAVLARVGPERFREPGVTPDGWTVTDVVVHTGAWLERCAEVLESIAAGTRDPANDDVSLDEVNAGHVERARDMSAEEAAGYLDAQRARARTALAALDGLTRDAWAWFEESGPMHYAKHAHDLTAWLAGVSSDPRVGSLLQADAESWVSFASALEAIDPQTALADPPGWTAHDVAFHVAMWLEVSVADLEANRGWPHDDDPGEMALVDAMNARWLTEGRGLAPDVVRARLDRARARLRAALAALPAPSEHALGWFEANTTEHHAEHLPALRLAGSPDARG